MLYNFAEENFREPNWKGDNAGIKYSFFNNDITIPRMNSIDLTLFQETDFRAFQTGKVLQTTISNLMKMALDSSKG